jgi:hypothetical protein
MFSCSQIRASDSAGVDTLIKTLGTGDALKAKINAELKKQGLKESIKVTDPVSRGTDPHYDNDNVHYRSCSCAGKSSYCIAAFEECNTGEKVGIGFGILFAVLCCLSFCAAMRDDDD